MNRNLSRLAAAAALATALVVIPALPASAGSATYPCNNNGTVVASITGTHYVNAYARTITNWGNCYQVGARVQFRLQPGGALQWSPFAYSSVSAYSPNYPYTYRGGHWGGIGAPYFETV